MKPNFLLTTTAIKIWLVQRGGILAQLYQFSIPLSFASITKMNFMIWQMFLLVSKCYFYPAAISARPGEPFQNEKNVVEHTKKERNVIGSNRVSPQMLSELTRLKVTIDFHLPTSMIQQFSVFVGVDCQSRRKNPRSFCYPQGNKRSVVDFRVKPKTNIVIFLTRMQCHYSLRVWNCSCVC